MRTIVRIIGGMLLAALLGAASPGASAAVACTAAATTLNFGSINALATGATTTATISYTCTNLAAVQPSYVNLCLNVGDGTSGTSGSARLLSTGATTLQYQLYQDPAATVIWGSVLSGQNTNPFATQFVVPANGSFSGTATLYSAILSGQGTIYPGIYGSLFTAGNAAATITFAASTSSTPTSCGTTNSGSNFPFSVAAVILKACTVAAPSNLNLGAVPSTQTNISATASMSVTCSILTPYYIGLSPSNGNAYGGGTMSGAAIPANTVPYTLWSNAGMSAAWGNTATSTSVGNGLAGIGTGLSQSIPIWASVASANFVPDSYSDVVTITVNY